MVTGLRRSPILFERFPGLSGKIPWMALGRFPTPVQRLSRLERVAGTHAIWIKRDDRSGPLYGGNKVRKLEFLLPEALQRKKRSLIVLGGIGSHHILATSLYGRELGLKTTALMFRQPFTGHVRRNLLAVASMGVEIHLLPDRAYLPIALLFTYFRGLELGTRRPYLVPPGGSSSLGILGYVDAALELAGQIQRGEAPEPDSIFVPVGSCGTMAGLEAGLRIAGIRSRLIGVRVVERAVANRWQIAHLANRALRLIRRKGGTLDSIRVKPRDILLSHDFFGGEYGLPTGAGRRAIHMMKEHEGIDLEPTYTGKALACLLDSAGRRVGSGKVLLFWNTFSSVNLSDRIKSNAVTVLPLPLRRLVTRWECRSCHNVG
jgi:D-cysteine desulfhydrase